MMDLELLKRFYVVGQCGNLTNAAKRLNIAQSALSRSISDFEYRLKMPLFSRTRKGVELNSKGLELYEYAKEVIDRTTQFEKKFYEDDEKVQGDLKIVTYPYAGAELLIPLIKEFTEVHPDLCISMSLDSDNIVPVQADIIIGSFIEGYPDLVQRHLLPVQTQLFASRQYLEINGELNTLKDLETHKIVTYKNFEYHSPYRSSNLIFSAMTDSGYEVPKAHFSVDSLHGVLSAALNGYGICELPNFPSIMKSGLQCVLPDVKGKDIPLNFTYRKNRSHSKKISGLYEHLKEKLIS